MRKAFAMGLVSGLLWVFALLVFPASGCNPVTTPTTAPLALQVLGNEERGATSHPLQGARVCELDNDENCLLTDEGGFVTIELPFEEEIAYTIDKEGYDGQLNPEVIPKSGIDRRIVSLPSVERIADFYDRLMSDYPRIGTGEIFIATDPELAGVTFDLPGATGKPYYGVANPGEESPLDPTATTSIGAGFSTVRSRIGGNRHVEFSSAHPGLCVLHGGGISVLLAFLEGQSLYD